MKEKNEELELVLEYLRLRNIEYACKEIEGNFSEVDFYYNCTEYSKKYQITLTFNLHSGMKYKLVCESYDENTIVNAIDKECTKLYTYSYNDEGYDSSQKIVDETDKQHLINESYCLGIFMIYLLITHNGKEKIRPYLNYLEKWSKENQGNIYPPCVDKYLDNQN